MPLKISKNRRSTAAARRRLASRVCRLGCLLVAALAVAGLTNVSQADVFLSYSPVPLTTSPAFPEFVWAPSPSIPQLNVGAGAHGNGDGNSPVSSQTPGGLELNTTFVVPFVAGQGQVNNVGSSTFFDTTLVLSGLSASATATISGPFIQQPLNGGTFDLYSTAAYPTLGNLLLSGTFGNAAIDAIGGSPTASILSNTVTYTGGSIYNALLANNGTNMGGSSFSLTLIGNTLFSVNPVTHYLANFNTSSTGQFSASFVPEPSALALYGLGSIGLIVALGRRRRMT